MEDRRAGKASALFNSPRSGRQIDWAWPALLELVIGGTPYIVKYRVEGRRVASTI